MSSNTSKLGTLKEEDSAGKSTAKMSKSKSQDSEHISKQEPTKGGRIVSPYFNNLGSKSRHNSISSNSLSSKTVGLGIARRPSDNLLLNMTSLENNAKAINDETVAVNSGLGLPPPRRNFITKAEKNDRPISNDSIATRTTELFSSTSSDVNSGSSSVENEHENENENECNEARNQSNGSGSCTDNDSASETNSVRNMSLSSHVSETVQPGGQVVGHAETIQRTRYFFNNGSKAESQISLAGSTSTLTSPARTLDNGVLQQSSLPTASPLYSKANSTSAILPNKTILTPSQRYRLRKAQNETALRKSIRRKEKFYDEQDKSPELKEDFENLLIWNIPVASASTNSFLSASKERFKPRKMPSDTNLPQSKNDHDPVHRIPYLDHQEMPTSPIPGVNGTTDFQYMQQATRNLSSVYVHSSNRLSRNKLSERTTSADFLPIEFKTASDLGLEDLKLVSEDKLEVTSHSRPSWLPPKDRQERKFHEEQISKSTSMASLDQLDRNKEQHDKAIRDETNRQKYILLLDRDITRNSSLQDLKKIIWETALSDETRDQVYNEVLQSSAKIITGEYLEPFEDLLKLLNDMDFPKGKEAEIEQLISSGVRCKIPGKDQVPADLPLMLKLKSISQQGLQCGDELLFHHFLLSKSFGSLKQVWDAVNLVQMTCFNDHCKEKFNSRILNSRGIVAHYLLRGDDFKREFNASCLNSSTWWNILERVEHSLFMWIMDIIVVANSQCFKKNSVAKQTAQDKSWDAYRAKHVVVNYKIQLSLVLNVLLNYHFGYNDLKSLSSLDDPNFCIPMPMDHLLDIESVNQMFVRKWLHYYKKF